MIAAYKEGLPDVENAAETEAPIAHIVMGMVGTAALSDCASFRRPCCSLGLWLTISHQVALCVDAG